MAYETASQTNVCVSNPWHSHLALGMPPPKPLLPFFINMGQVTKKQMKPEPEHNEPLAIKHVAKGQIPAFLPLNITLPIGAVSFAIAVQVLGSQYSLRTKGLVP